MWRSARAAILADVRSRPDVRSGISRDTGPGPVRSVEYRPGGGRRFTLALADLPAGGTLAWVAEFGRGFALPSGGPVRHGDVQDGLRCSVTDAVALAELIGFLTGREALSAERFAERACA